MLFFSTDFDNNHHRLAIWQADEGAQIPEPEKQVGTEHVAYELAAFAELQEAYRTFKKHWVKIHHTAFHGITKSICFFDPDGNLLEVNCNVPPEEYNKSMPNLFSSYHSFEEEMQAPQKPGTVAP